MTTNDYICAVVAALGLPPEASVDARVPKKLLVEQGAPTTADKRAIQDGIDELQWFAACKPATVGVPTFADDTRKYEEIAVVGCVFRPSAKSPRLIQLIHRAIPYPVVLIASENDELTISVAHKRHAQNEAGKTVIEQVVATKLKSECSQEQTAFLKSLPLAQQPRADLFALYDGWLSCIEALNAARMTGGFVLIADSKAIIRRRTALSAYEHLTKEIDTLRRKANREKQLNRRVDLNMAIQRLEADLAEHKKNL